MAPPISSPASDLHHFPWTPPRSLYWIGLAVTIFVCSTFIFFFCYRESVTNSRLSRNRRRRLDESNQDDSLQLHSQGLEDSVIQSLPISQFKQKDKEGHCAICLGGFEDGDWIKHLPNCSHDFHIACIDTWFQAHSNCPLCRSRAADEIKSLRREEVAGNYRIGLYEQQPYLNHGF